MLNVLQGRQAGRMGTEGYKHFIHEIMEADLAEGRHRRIVTRFPPEPNGYLHLGHTKAICLNFGLAEQYGGLCYLRFDDTNPSKESLEYVASMKTDVHWLDFQWAEVRHASDYFDRLYDFAETLIEKGKAYVDSLSMDEIKEYRGDWHQPGRPSPHRDRPAHENLDLFRRMRAGEFADGEHVLRARIDMAAANMNLRDPILYRIRHVAHQNTGEKWCIYPTYDMAHGQSDAIEGVTHSLCTLEFEDHRPLYDWLVTEIGFEHPPRQIEFARLQLEYTVLSKRRLISLVEGGHVYGWDDPRMPTISGIRRRGYTPAALRRFCDQIGVTRQNSVVEMSALENAVREDLNENAPRAMAVLDPVKVVIDNYP